VESRKCGRRTWKLPWLVIQAAGLLAGAVRVARGWVATLVVPADPMTQAFLVALEGTSLMSEQPLDGAVQSDVER